MPEDSKHIYPKDNFYLLGHEEAEQFLLNAWKNNSLHNSWLFSGIEGIGKATLAYRFARFLLSADSNKRNTYTNFNIAPDNQTCRLISNNSHPDLKIIERDYTDTDRRKLMKSIKEGTQLSSEEMQNLKRSAYIRVDDVRTINEFLSKRSSQDGWRIVIVDSIDDMNISSANAILKILEEPPHKTLMLLISHNPNRLLPTIKSRCAKLMLKPLNDSILSSLLRRYRPELSEDAIKGLTSISSGSIGKALNYIDNDALNQYERLKKIIIAGTNFKLSELFAFCDQATIDEDSFELSKNLILKLIRQLAQENANIENITQSWEDTIRIFNETAGLNLDKKQALITIINNLCKRI
ncbi:MAG: hypothetical protein IJX20_02570 [Alphaproteobacteria bacterium]|nr:hypothetical protein [Alphaproteobacteria bacterium]